VENRCYTHRHLTPEEYGLWVHARELAHASGVFYFSGPAVARHFRGTTKTTIYRVAKSLVSAGWFLEKQKSRHDPTTGVFRAAQYEPISHDEWAERHPGQCTTMTEIEHGTMTEIEHGRSQFRDSPFPISELAMTDSGNKVDRLNGKNKSKEKTALNSDSDPCIKQAIERVFDYYREKIGKSAAYSLTGTRLQQGKSRLADGAKMARALRPELPEDELPAAAEKLMCYAVDRMAESDWNMGRDPKSSGKRYDDWDLLFRSTEQFQKWTEKDPVGGRPIVWVEVKESPAMLPTPKEDSFAARNAGTDRR
jgi:hypothetical protein